MTSVASASPARWRVEETLALHAVLWLVVGSAVGLVLSLLLVVPDAGRALGPVTFGRLAPLHLDLLLYGWGALPVVGLLLSLYGCGASAGRRSALAIQVWSASLVVGAGSWLAGQASGKLFLDWAGPARTLFLANLAFLALTLGRGLVAEHRSAAGGARLSGKAALLALLCVVPLAMLVATDPRTYPAIDPRSGGPTGASLLGSSLGILWIFLATPWALRLERAPGAETGRPLGLLVLHTLTYLAIARGDHSNHEVLEVAAVLSLVPWAVWLPRWLSRVAWPAIARPWIGAFLAWGAALVGSGVASFLPGVLDHVKFTNLLVGHAHVALAGMWTCYGVIVLSTLLRDTRLADLFGDRRAFTLWNAGCAVQVFAVGAVGAAEWVDPGILFRPQLAVNALYAVRAAAGATMLAATVLWWRRAVRGTDP